MYRVFINAGYDDFIVGSNIDKDLISDEVYSISYDVKEFEDISKVNKDLKDRGVEPIDASVEVGALLETFSSLRTVFQVIAVIVFVMGVFMSSTLLIRIQNSRYREVGLLAALGFSKTSIWKLLSLENMIIATMGVMINIVLTIISTSFLNVGLQSILLTSIATFIIVLIISMASSRKLITIDPARALQK